MATTRKPLSDTTSDTFPDTSSSAVEPPSRVADSRDRIAQRAYELYLQRGGADGGDFDDWLAAEREIAPDRSDRGDAGE